MLQSTPFSSKKHLDEQNTIFSSVSVIHRSHLISFSELISIVQSIKCAINLIHKKTRVSQWRLRERKKFIKAFLLLPRPAKESENPVKQ